MRPTTLLLILTMLLSLPASAGEWWIPAAAHATGAEGSTWRTDLTIRNLDPVAQTVFVTLLPRDTDNATAVESATLQVAGAGAVRVNDALFALSGYTGAAALRLGSFGDNLVVTSRTYNLGGDGSFGQSIPAVALGAEVQAGEEALLLGLSGTGGRRTNLGWVNIRSTPITVTVELLDANGSRLARRSYPEYGFGHSQLNDLFATLGVAAPAAAYARVSANGAFIPYASVIAGGSNDPVYVAPRSGLELATELLIPAVVNGEGLNDTTWQSDVWILNQGSRVATVELALWRQSQANPTPATDTLELAPGQQALLEDVVLGRFAAAGAQGALAITADQLLLATSRTYNTAEDGTFGQFIPAQPLRSLGGAGETLYLPAVDHGGDFRSNIGLVAAGSGATVLLKLRDGGQVLASARKTLAENQQLQYGLHNLFGLAPEVVTAAATVEITVESTTDGARVAPYLSMVDNLTGDPTYTPAARSLGSVAAVGEVTGAVIVVTDVLGNAADEAGPSATAPPKGSRTNNSTEFARNRAADLAWAIERIRRSSPSYIEDFAIEPESKMRCSWDAKRGRYSSAGPEAACVTVQYSGDTIRPGESPEGACWQSTITWDACVFEFPSLGVTLTRDGVAAADVCVLDDYPSHLSMDIASTLRDHDSGDYYTLTQVADLALAFTFDGWRVATAHLDGAVEVELDGYRVYAWGDLTWAQGATALEPYPSGVLLMTFPAMVEGVELATEVTVTYDGSEWAFVQVRLGLWQTAFWVNLDSGELRPA